MAVTESQIQIAFFDWCRLWAQRPGYSDLAWIFHVPNGGARSKATAGRMKAEGVTPGIADVLWLRQRGADPVYGPCYLAIEFKARTGGQTQAQRQFEAWVKEKCGVYIVCRSAGEAALAVCEWANWHGDILADAQELARRDADQIAALRAAGRMT